MAKSSCYRCRSLILQTGFIVLQDAIHTTKGKKETKHPSYPVIFTLPEGKRKYPSYPAINPVSYNCNWPGKTCPLVQ